MNVIAQHEFELVYYNVTIQNVSHYPIGFHFPFPFNAHEYVKILCNFLIPSIENGFGFDEVIFQDGNASCLW